MNTIEKMARAIYAAFDAQDGYVGDFRFFQSGETTLDGQFDLEKIARAALESLREPSGGMVDAGYNWGRDAPDSGIEESWRAMIDHALSEAREE